jgi:hypothetical protein
MNSALCIRQLATRPCNALAVFAYYKYERYIAELVASMLSEEAFSSARVSDGSSETYEACRLSPRKRTVEEPLMSTCCIGESQFRLGHLGDSSLFC